MYSGATATTTTHFSAPPNINKDWQFTTLNTSFTLILNYNSISQSGPKSVLDVMTHELGHALGFLNWVTKECGRPSNPELLPNSSKNISYRDEPTTISNTYFPKTLSAYNKYYGTLTYNFIFTYSLDMPFNKSHLYNIPFGSKEPEPAPQTAISSMYYKRGFQNEIMVSTLNIDTEYYINEISLSFLLDLYTECNGIKYYNYSRKDSSSECILSTDAPNLNIVFLPNETMTKSINIINLDSDITNKLHDSTDEEIIFTCGCQSHD